jgi:hypothetical protein
MAFFIFCFFEVTLTSVEAADIERKNQITASLLIPNAAKNIPQGR